jgi:predicted amidohydrolase
MDIKDNLGVTLTLFDPVWESPVQNRRRLQDQILELRGKSDLVILPETFTTGFSNRASELAEPMDGPTVEWMVKLSNQSGLAIGGSLLVRDEGLIFNRFVFVTPQGDCCCYDKRHLFSIGGESDLLKTGSRRVTVNYLGWKITLYICYDLRFPVWCRNTDETDLMIFTANWPYARREVWNILLKARAIENQVYVAGVNRTGTDGNGLTYMGDSQLINARGEALQSEERPANGWLSYTISKKELTDFRERFPVLKDADRFLIT